MTTALITGASVGIGRELSLICAAQHMDLVLISRDCAALNLVAKQCQTLGASKCLVIANDLTKREAATTIVEELDKQGTAIDILINNAGFGSNGPFMESDLGIELSMIDLNVRVLVELTRLIGSKMAAQRSGRIMNVASTAAFQPGPLMATYYATKAFVLSFSEALAEELSGYGISVTTLCPGPTRTEFAKRAGIENSRMFHEKFAQSMDSVAVAAAGFEGMMRGKRLVIPGLMNRISSLAVRLVPIGITTKITKRLNFVSK
jgi:short-subunit dehydrogenase